MNTEQQERGRAIFRLQDGRKSGKEKLLDEIETSEILGKYLFKQ